MKANEAPEKLYLDTTDNPDNVWLRAFRHPFNTCGIEYTRTDAIIEKTKKAMIEWASTYASKTGKGVKERKALAFDLLNYFKEYMEESTTAI